MATDRDPRKKSECLRPKDEPRFVWKYQKTHGGAMPPKDWSYKKR